MVGIPGNGSEARYVCPLCTGDLHRSDQGLRCKAGDRGVLQYRRIREYIAADHGIHVFEVGELEEPTRQADFVDYRPWSHGSVLVFSARRKEAQSTSAQSA